MTNPLQPFEGEIRDALTAEGYEIVELFFGPGRFLRLCLDLEGGLDLRACTRAHRKVQAVVTDQGLDPGDFRIEVESPGVDRPLRRPEDFERFRGERVLVTLKEKDESGRRRFRGALEGATAGTVRVALQDRGVIEVPLDDVESVRLDA